MRRSRGFTLLELMLAAALGSIVIVTALGVFGAIDRADRRSRQRMVRSQGLEAVQRTAERALRSLIMAPSTALPIPAPGGAGGARQPAGAENPVVVDTERPRLLLHEDDAYAGLMVYKDEQGVQHPFVPQRLEIVVQSAPVFAEPRGDGVVEPVMFVGTVRARQSSHDRQSAEGSARERSHSRRSGGRSAGGRSGSGESAISDSSPGGERSAISVPGSGEGAPDDRSQAGSDRAAGDNRGRAGDEGEGDGRDVPLAPGIRGVFETRFEPARGAREIPPSGGLGGELAAEGRGSWSLWWRPLPLEVGDEADLPPADAPVSAERHTGPVRLATGLRMCRWEMVRNDETVHELEATHWEELPAYVTLEIETDMGQWQKWMFEVGATRGQEPGTPIEGVLAGATIQPGIPGADNGATGAAGTPSAGGKGGAPMPPTRGTSRTTPGSAPSATRGRPAAPARPSGVRPMSPGSGPRTVPSPAPGHQPEGGP